MKIAGKCRNLVLNESRLTTAVIGANSGPDGRSRAMTPLPVTVLFKSWVLAKVPAGTSEEPFYAQRADALAEIAEIYLTSDKTPTADRYQVVIHVSPRTLKDTPTAGARPDSRPPNLEDPTNPNLSHIEDGPHVPAGTIWCNFAADITGWCMKGALVVSDYPTGGSCSGIGKADILADYCELPFISHNDNPGQPRA